MAPSLVTDYRVGAGNITLSITVGEGQVGGSVVRLGDQDVAIGDVKRVTIGPGPSVKGKELFVKSVVTDVDRKADRTSVRYELKGGREDRVFQLEATVNKKGGAAVYRATFHLKS
jgi:hypothetical protein